MTVHCPLTREQATLYQAVVDDMLEQADDAEGIERRGLVLAGIMKLKQVCNHPAHFLARRLARWPAVRQARPRRGDARRDRSPRATGALLHPVRRVGRRCSAPTCSAATARGPLFLHGGVAGRRRDDDGRRSSRAGAGPPIFLLSLKAGGTGLNLTAATHVFHFDRWWNPAVEDQATDRAYRIGQRRTVQVHKLVCAGTLEERIDELITSKRALAQRVVGTGEAWLTELSTADLRDVISLRGSSSPIRRAFRGGVMAAERRPPPPLPAPAAADRAGGTTPGGRSRVEAAPAEGGIASSKARGGDGRSWWSKRFVDALESYGLGGRMTRGGRMPRKGASSVTRRDSRPAGRAGAGFTEPSPYAVTVRLQTPTATQWQKIEDALRTRVGYAARLLAGEVPARPGRRLRRCRRRPSSRAVARDACDVQLPDWGDPCKHQAAVLYVFADQLDADPWLLLQWHGRTRDDVVGLVGAAASRVGRRRGRGRAVVAAAAGRWRWRWRGDGSGSDGRPAR